MKNKPLIIDDKTKTAAKSVIKYAIAHPIFQMGDFPPQANKLNTLDLENGWHCVLRVNFVDGLPHLWLRIVLSSKQRAPLFKEVMQLARLFGMTGRVTMSPVLQPQVEYFMVEAMAPVDGQFN